MGYYITETQQKVLDYLKANPDWQKPYIIGMQIGGKPLPKATAWACRILTSKALKGLVESNGKGRWRYAERVKVWE